ncbi:MAG: autotransporter-associated beta strand repeat-containing protein, partial [Kiritimatiellae bacterium]|nr:autotransporter-associated beta strand repeat-containing protein [Kiritimatiellia bacterium]
KKGAGTLTLTAVPKYTGLTTVEEGTLVVPEGTEVTVNALYANNVPENATVVGYGYPAGTTIETPTVSGSVTYNAPLDCSGLVAIDASGIELTSGVPYVIAAATQITKWRHQTPIELTLPDGVDASKWKLSVRTIGGKRCLCLVDFDMGSMLIFR